MTNAGSFDTWMNDTQIAIELIQELGNTVYSQKSYESPQFSYKFNEESKTWVYRYNRVLEFTEVVGISPGQHTHTQQITTLPAITSPHSINGVSTGGAMINHNGNISINAPLYNQGVSSNSNSTPGINSVIIHVEGYNNTITSITWVRKTNSDLVFVSNTENTFGKMHGGTVRASMLFLPNNKILVNDKVYSHETPDAFNTDISGDVEHMRYLDLLEMRERYRGKLFN